MKTKTPLSIYIHIPFCLTKCLYCDFLSFDGSEDVYEPYVDALCRHIFTSAATFANYEVVTVFFGGGTPTILSTAQLCRILDVVCSNYSMSNSVTISTEANPETVNAVYLADLRNAGFNRISFGVQSFNDKHLAAIGRLHSAKKAAEAVRQAHQAGFDDINLDLIFALPYQAVYDFEKSLDTAVKLPITHISCYALTPEEGTPLAHRNDLLDAICGEETDRAMYHLAAKKLAAAGFNHYEISNWAKDGFSCHHNIGYWTGREYMGFGLGAHSFVNNSRFCNTSNLTQYIGGHFAANNIEKIDKSEAMTEFIILGLRLTKGISPAKFAALFNENLHGKYAEKLDKLHNQGLIEINSGNIRLTKKGLDLSNTVFTEFI